MYPDLFFLLVGVDDQAPPPFGLYLRLRCQLQHFFFGPEGHHPHVVELAWKEGFKRALYVFPKCYKLCRASDRWRHGSRDRENNPLAFKILLETKLVPFTRPGGVSFGEEEI